MGTQGRDNESLLDSDVKIKLGTGNELCHLLLMQNRPTLRAFRLGGETNERLLARLEALLLRREAEAEQRRRRKQDGPKLSLSALWTGMPPGVITQPTQCRGGAWRSLAARTV